jgi:hypothetical protein
MTDTQTIVANVDPLTETKEFRFRFKKDKLGNQRQAVELKLPVPNAQGIIHILETGGKDLELLLEVIADTVRSQAAGLVSDDEKISQESFPLDKITWTAIANQPRAERTKIADELWEAFGKDYIEIMPSITNKSVDAVTNAVGVYLKKFAIVKTNKPILKKLQEQLALYVEHTKNGEQFQEILDLLTSKLDAYLKADDVELLIQNL